VKWFNSDEGRSKIRRLAKGVGTLSISKASLAEMTIPEEFVRSNSLVLSEEPARYGVKAHRSAGVRAGKAGSNVPKAWALPLFHS